MSTALPTNAVANDGGFWGWLAGPKSPAPVELPINEDTFAGNYLASRFAQSQRDWESAYTFLENALALEEDTHMFDGRSLVVSLAAGRTEDAVEIGQKILSDTPENLSDFARLLLIADDFKNNDYDAAIEKLDSITSGPFQLLVQPVMLRWALLASDKEDPREANDKSALDLLHTALVSELRGDLQSAEQSFEKLSMIDNTAQTQMIIADYHARHGAVEKAADIYSDLNIKNPDFTGFHQRLKAIEKEDKESLQDLIDASYLYDPKDGAAMAIINIARYFYQERSYDSALLFAQIAKHMSPNRESLNIVLGDIHSRQENFDKALLAYAEEKPHTPYFLQAKLKSIQVLRQAQRMQEAKDIASDILREFPNNPEALYQFAEILRASKNYEDAIETYTRIEDLFPDAKKSLPQRFANIYYVRGIAYEQNGNWPKAVKDFKTALTYFPNNPYILNYLGYGMADRGEQLEEALEMIQAAVSLRPFDGYIRDSLGWVYYKQGAYEKATTILERAVELEAYDPIINDHLGDAYWKVGRHAEARFQWRRALNHSTDAELSTAITEKLKSGLSPARDL